MKLCVVIPSLNQREMLRTTYEQIKSVTEPTTLDVEFLMIDNGSDVPLTEEEVPGARIVRLEKSIGVYPVFWEALKHTDADVLAFLHSDVVIWEQGWNARVEGAFGSDPRLGLVGFVGSDEIDSSGGRGLGTCSNFMGRTLTSPRTGVQWTGSRAEQHGKRVVGLNHAAVEDGCVMIFRRSVLEAIPQRTNFPPHHFYDRLMSCEVRERGFDIRTMGIEFDHFSGQTVGREQKYYDMARAWCETWNVPIPNDNTDMAIYQEGERQWLSEYRDKKHFIPCKV